MSEKVKRRGYMWLCVMIAVLGITAMIREISAEEEGSEPEISQEETYEEQAPPEQMGQCAELPSGEKAYTMTFMKNPENPSHVDIPLAFHLNEDQFQAIFHKSGMQDLQGEPILEKLSEEQYFVSEAGDEVILASEYLEELELGVQSFQLVFESGTELWLDVEIAEEPAVTEPETDEAEITEPERTKPEEAEPPVSEPEITAPEGTESEVTDPEPERPKEPVTSETETDQEPSEKEQKEEQKEKPPVEEKEEDAKQLPDTPITSIMPRGPGLPVFDLTASVEDDAENKGSQINPVMVKQKNYVTYKINTAGFSGTLAPNLTYRIEQTVPAGMTVAGMSYEANTDLISQTTAPSGETILLWEAVNGGAREYMVFVTVDWLSAGTAERMYISQTKALIGGTVMGESNPTYHQAKVTDICFYNFTKGDQKGVAGFGFKLYRCANPAHAAGGHGADCTWSYFQTYCPQQFSDADGLITFPAVDRNDTYLLTRDTEPSSYYDVLSYPSYILVKVGGSGDYTLTPYGDFAKRGLLADRALEPFQGTYKLYHRLLPVRVSVRNEISGCASLPAAAQAKVKEVEFPIRLNGQTGISLKHEGEASGLKLEIGKVSDVIEIEEIVPMDFDKNYQVKAFVISPDIGPTVQTGKQISVKPGNDVIITITNQLSIKSYFRDSCMVRDRFKYA